MEKILSIGTVVRVGAGDDLLMITGRYPLTIQNGVKGYFDYSSCIYPVGVAVDEEPLLFNHEDIVEILFEGYVHPMEEKLREYYQKNIALIPYPKLSIHD